MVTGDRVESIPGTIIQVNGANRILEFTRFPLFVLILPEPSTYILLLWIPRAKSFDIGHFDLLLLYKAMSIHNLYSCSYVLEMQRLWLPKSYAELGALEADSLIYKSDSGARKVS